MARTIGDLCYRYIKILLDKKTNRCARNAGNGKGSIRPTRTAVEIDARLHGHAGWKKGGRNNTLRGNLRSQGSEMGTGCSPYVLLEAL